VVIDYDELAITSTSKNVASVVSVPQGATLVQLQAAAAISYTLDDDTVPTATKGMQLPSNNWPLLEILIEDFKRMKAIRVGGSDTILRIQYIR
jgi:hypothetical protein